MLLKKLIGKMFQALEHIKEWAETGELIYQKEDEETSKGIYSLWDFLSFSENTQAFHLVNVIGFDEWVDMEEIRRRIKEVFSIEYKNEKSLYPYLKTMTDINLFETTSIGGRRKWRKKNLLFEIEMKNEEEDKKQGLTVKIKAKNKM